MTDITVENIENNLKLMETLRFSNEELEALKKVRDKVTELKHNYDISLLDKNIRILVQAMGIQNIDEGFRILVQGEIQKLRLVQEILEVI